MEQLRRELDIDTVNYAEVGIDDRQGTEDVNVYVVTVYAKDGKAYGFGDLSVDHIGDWGPVYTGPWAGWKASAATRCSTARSSTGRSGRT